MGLIRWLHLTDLHVGMKGLKDYWPGVEEVFFDDLTFLHEEAGPWHLLIFTGDLTQRASVEEFEQVNQLLEKFQRKFRELGSSPEFLSVPGNHDLTRPNNPHDPALVSLLNLWDKPEVSDYFWTNADSPQRKLVEAAFKNYTGWWKQARSSKCDIRDGILPGDFSASFEHDDVKLGICGLNSAFLHLADVRAGKLALHVRQLNEACGEPPYEWVRKHDACLLLTHHPEDWLTPDSKQQLNGEIYPSGRFAAHIFGHMHESNLTSVAYGGADERRYLQGASLFGMEGWGKGGKKRRIHGYSLCELNVLDDRAELRIWPRLAIQKKNGGWVIERDQTSYTLIKGKDCTRPLPVLLQRQRARKAPARKADNTSDEQSEPTHKTDATLSMTKSEPARHDSYGNLKIPSHYLPRPDVIEHVVKALLENDNYTLPTVLHGMGGIGKTVIARAICDEQRVRLRFSDGILSITLGQTPVIVKELRRLVEALEGRVSETLATKEGLKSDLTNVLRTRKCLLIIDDAWQASDVEYFRAGGPDCRVLITTRVKDVAYKLGVEPLGIPLMSQDEAVKLLEAWARGKLVGDPELKVQIVRRLGMLPLAIKLAGAMLSKQPPKKRLENLFDNLKFQKIEHPHDSLKLTFDLSLKMLDEAMRQLYVSLAIFREDELVPEVAIEKLWSELYDADAEQTFLSLSELDSSALLQLSETGGQRSVSIHDMLRSYMMTELSAEGELAAHQALLEGYRRTAAEGAWPTAPDDGYLYDHLVYHLKEAGAVEELKSLFKTPDWMEVRIKSDNYNYDGYLADLNIAWQLAAEAAPADEKAVADCLLYALLHTSFNSISSNYASFLILRAVETGLWEFDRAVSIIAKKEIAFDRAESYAALLSLDFLSAEQRAMLEKKGITAALQVPNAEYTYKALSLLLPSLSVARREEVVQFLIKSAKGRDHYDKPEAIIAVAPHLDEKKDGAALQELLEALGDDGSPFARVAALAAIADRLSGEWRAQVEERALKIAQTEEPEENWRLLIFLIRHLTGERKEQATQEVLAGLASIPLEDSWLKRPRVEVLGVLAEQAGDNFVPEILDAILNIRPNLLWVSALKALAHRLTGEQLERAWKSAEEIELPSIRWSVLALLAPRLEEGERKSFIKCLSKAARAEPDPAHRTQLFLSLGSLLQSPEKEDAWREAQVAAQKIEAPWERLRIFTALVPVLPEAKRAPALQGAVSALLETNWYKYSTDEIKTLSPYLQGEALAEALSGALVIGDESWSAQALAVLAHRLTGQPRESAVQRALDFVQAETDLRVIGQLAPLLSDDKRLAILQRALEHSLKLPEWHEHSSMKPRAEAIRDLAPHLTGSLFDKAVEASLQMTDNGRGGQWLALLALAPHLHSEEHIRTVFEAAIRLGDPNHKAEVIAALAGKLPDNLFKRAIAVVDESAETFNLYTRMELLARLLPRLNAKQQKHYIESALSRIERESGSFQRSIAIENLAPQLPEPFWERAIKLAEQIAEPEYATRALAALARRLKGHRREEVVGEALNRALMTPEAGIFGNPRLLALSYVGDLLGGEMWERGWEAALTTYDEELPLRALMTFVPSAPSPEKAIAGVRRAIVNHLQHLSRNEPRTTLLYFIYTDKSFNQPILSPDAIGLIAGHVDSVCYNWRWF